MLNVKRVSYSVGALFAVMHTLGIIAVLSGVTDYLLQIHFLSAELRVASFSTMLLIKGIITAALAGLVTGWLFAVIYNWIEKKVK